MLGRTMSNRAQIPRPEALRPELAQLERVIDGLQRTWIRADDDAVEIARHRIERLLDTEPSERELCESALQRLERARLQARLRGRERE